MCKHTVYLQHMAKNFSLVSFERGRQHKSEPHIIYHVTIISAPLNPVMCGRFRQFRNPP